MLSRGGVVTGTVTNARGNPVVAIGIRVWIVRDESGRSFASAGRYYESMTDDRGVYRVYGLPTGTYVVSADGSVNNSSTVPVNVNPFANDVPTYAPSSNREDADEINVRAGEEVSNVNIRYRGERGSTISGTVRGLRDDDWGFHIALTSIVDAGRRWNDQVRGASGEFAFDGIPDGDYHLIATTGSDRNRRVSESMVLTIRGVNSIEGIELMLARLALINGQVVLETLKTAPPECTEKLQPQFSEMSVTAWHRATEGAKRRPQFVWRAGGPLTPDGQGKFIFAGLPASEYYFALRFSNQQWYLQSIAFAPSAPNGTPTDATRTWTTVKPGDQLSGLTFTLAQGGALIRGEISHAEGPEVPEKLVVSLIPTEAERADDVLRYFAAPVTSDGRFWLHNVAPGRYWMLAQPGTDDTRYEVSKVRLPDGAEIRSSLRRIAQETKTEIEIKPCQDVTFRRPLYTGLQD